MDFTYRFFYLCLITILVYFIGLLFQQATSKYQKVRWQADSIINRLSFGLASLVLIVWVFGLTGIPNRKNNVIIVLLAISVFFILLLFYKNFKKKKLHFEFETPSEILSFVGILISLFIIKTIQVDALIVPNWIDGWIHTSLLEKMLAKEAVSVDGIYHNGFHFAVLVMHFLLGQPLPETVLFFGQWLAVLSGLTFYSFINRYIPHPFLSLVSLLVYALILLFPSRLVTWGRYPLLMGLTLLFPTIVTSWGWINKRQGSYFQAVVYILSLALVHYGALLIWFSALITYFVVFLISKSNVTTKLSRIKRFFSGFLMLIAPLIVPLLPKMINLFKKQNIISAMRANVSDPDFGFNISMTLQLILKHDFIFVVIWIVVLFVLILIPRFKSYFIPWQKNIWLFGTIWLLAVFLFSWMQYQFFGLSVSNYINVLVFFSVALTISSVVMIGFIRKQLHYRYNSLIFVVLLLLGIYSNKVSISSETILFTPDDQRAMEWIRANTDESDTFLVRSFPWGGAMVPSDGGGWINFLTERRITNPQNLGDFYDAAKYIQLNDVDYIYLGKDIYPDFSLRISDLNIPYEVVYHIGSTTILSVNSQ